MSVKQAVETFGDAVSHPVPAIYDRSQYDVAVEIMHAIEPDPDHILRALGQAVAQRLLGMRRACG
jgi:hypothetical protein